MQGWSREKDAIKAARKCLFSPFTQLSLESEIWPSPGPCRFHRLHRFIRIHLFVLNQHCCYYGSGPRNSSTAMYQAIMTSVAVSSGEVDSWLENDYQVGLIRVVQI